VRPLGAEGKTPLLDVDPKLRRVVTIMETVDYVWLSGLGVDAMPSDTSF
jgi:hypothetical protein